MNNKNVNPYFNIAKNINYNTPPYTDYKYNNEYRANQTNIILSEGDTGDEVIILQEKLKILNFFPGTITGSFGPETTTSVKSFQKSINYPITGNVNETILDEIYKATDEELFPTPASVLSKPTLRLGDTGEYVKELQISLKALMFYDGAIDGIFGNSTNTAVKKFQTNNKLTADGIVGRNTWSALIYLYSPLAICDGGEEIKFVGVVIDAGHGGNDPGAVSSEIIEKEYTLKISQYMANRFRELGVPFAMTRNTDETLTNSERIARMKEPFGDVSNAIVISNHINAGGGEGQSVTQYLYNS